MSKDDTIFDEDLSDDELLDDDVSDDDDMPEEPLDDDLFEEDDDDDDVLIDDDKLTDEDDDELESDDDEDTEALDDLEAEELEMLTEDEASETIVVDEESELRDIRRAQIAIEASSAGGAGADEFVCSVCFLVKKSSQLANRRRKICFDCAD